MFGKLYVVATPIGNLDDLSYRAEYTLKSVSIIAAEDTRTSKKLLNNFNINTKLVAYHNHNEIQQSKSIVKILKNGDSVALISDAGTPCISDPGYRVVNLALRERINVVAIPGPCSLTAALSISGLPTDRFFFEGFLPPKKGRKTRFELFQSLPATIVIFESPHRIIRTLNDIYNHLGDRVVSVCRELTKMYEEVLLCSISDAINHFTFKKVKGELIILIAKDGYSLD